MSPRIFLLVLTVASASILLSGCLKGDLTCASDADCDTGRDTCNAELKSCVPKSCTTKADCGDAFICGAKGFCAAQKCNPACSATDECTAAAVCEARYTAVRIVKPTVAVGPGGMTVVAVLDVAAGRTRADPETLAVEITSGGQPSANIQLTRTTEGRFEGEWVPAEGKTSFVLTARYAAAGLTSAPVSVALDTERPTFSVTVPPLPRPATANLTVVDPQGLATDFKRSDTVVAVVKSPSADVDPDAVTVNVIGWNGAAEGSAVSFQAQGYTEGCDAAWCGRAYLHMWKPELRAYRADMRVVVDGRDLGNNPAEAPPERSLTVTRFKWMYRAGSEPIPSSPAIGTRGTIYFGGSSSSIDLHALGPDGSEAWKMAAGGAVSVAPLVSRAPDGSADHVYYAHGGVLSRVRSDSATETQTLYQAPVGQTFNSSLSLVSNGRDEEMLFGVLSDENERGKLIGARLTGPDLQSEPESDSNFNAAVRDRGNVVADSSNVFFGNNKEWVLRYEYTKDSLTRSTSGWPMNAASNGSLLLRAQNVVGAVTRSGTLFSIPYEPQGPVAGLWGTSHTGTAVVMQTPAVAIATTQNPIFVASDVSAANGLGKDHPLPALAQVHPLVGTGTITYFVTAVGGLAVYNRDLAKIWEVPFLFGNTPRAPNIDCARDAQGLKVPGAGILYVPTSNGSLYAIAVDSPGIAIESPWPRFQHDPRNTGNASTDLGEFACP